MDRLLAPAPRHRQPPSPGPAADAPQSAPDLPPDRAGLERLAQATLTPADQLEAMVLHPGQGLSSIGSSRAHNVLPFLGLQFLQVCPLCLATDTQPYLRTAWLTGTAVACAVHGGPLLDHCPHCRRHLQIFRARPPARRPGTLRVSRWIPFFLDTCFSCRQPLSDQRWPATPLPPEPILPTVFEGLSIPNAADWEPFTAALALLVRAFAVIDLVQVEGDHLTSVPRQGGTRHDPLRPIPWSNAGTATSRFKAERIKRIALTTRPGDTLRASLRHLSQSIYESRPANAVMSSPRWRYLSWSTRRLVQVVPEELLWTWPALVSFLSSALIGQDPLRSSVPLGEFRLTDEQWELVDDDLSMLPDDVGDPDARRNALETYMYRLTVKTGWKQLPDSYAASRCEREYIEFWIMGWEFHRRLRRPLERLYHHLKGVQPNLLVAQNAEIAWQCRTARFFLTDDVIQLLTTSSSPLADEILDQLQAASTAQSLFARHGKA